MRYIKKKRIEPAFLKNFKEELSKSRTISMDTYAALRDDNTGVFTMLQETLAKEQGYLCAYCLGELKKDERSGRIKMQVEHFKPKSIFNGQVNTPIQTKKLCIKEELRREDLRIDYHNLFAVCEGRSGEADSETHCDKSPNGKDDKELCFITNPSYGRAKDFNLKIRYTKRGNIVSDDEDIDQELKEVLNLNEQNLVKRRIYVWNAVARKIAKETGTENWEQQGKSIIPVIQKKLAIYKKPKRDGKYYEFRECIVYLLEWKIRILNK